MGSDPARYDAVRIESAFRKLIGTSSTGIQRIYAGVFRDGEPNELSRALLEAAKAIEKRVNNISNINNEMINIAVDGLKKTADEMKLQKDKEPYDYHWVIIGNLVSVIDILINAKK